MGSLDSRYFQRINAAEIDDDLPCHHCGFNLVGLKYNSRCPECGTLIGDVFGADRLKDFGPTVILRDPGRFSDSPSRYRQALAATLGLLGLGGLALIGSAATMAVWPSLLVGVLLLVSSCLWSSAVFELAGPRMVAKPKNVNTSSEWGLERKVARWSQLLWPIGALVLLGGYPTYVELPQALTSSLAVAGQVVLLAAALGMTALLVQLGNVANWMGDTGLSFRSWTCAWAVGVGWVLVAGVWWTGGMRATMEGRFFELSTGVTIASVAGFLGLAPVVYLTVVFAQCLRLADWVKKHANEPGQADLRRMVSSEPAVRASARNTDAPIPLVGVSDPEPRVVQGAAKQGAAKRRSQGPSSAGGDGKARGAHPDDGRRPESGRA